MEVIIVTARRWRDGWELELTPEHITQARTLDTAPQQVRDYLSTLHPDRDYSGVAVEIHQVNAENKF